jgi:hypothetical protein
MMPFREEELLDVVVRGVLGDYLQLSSPSALDSAFPSIGLRIK